jgi:hypothetical protein
MKKISFILFCLLFSFSFVFSQEKKSLWSKIPRYNVDISKYGPFIGFQRGLYNNIEFGAEYQWKKIKLIKPYTHTAHVGFNYNLYNNVLGYEVGYWFKQGRMNLTYGLNIIYRTNSHQNAIGFTPLIGFKFSQIHIQTGYNFLSKDPKIIFSNDFFISFRLVFIQNRDIDIERKN